MGSLVLRLHLSLSGCFRYVSFYQPCYGYVELYRGYSFSDARDGHTTGRRSDLPRYDVDCLRSTHNVRGATPVFIDVLPDTWCIDPGKIEAAITPRTKAIMPVHLYGNVCEMDEILAIARKHNLFVIEDAAEALGSEYKGRKAGSMGDFGVFSFHGTKTATTGEGGMLVTNNANLFDEARIHNDHGRDHRNPKQFWMERIGYKYKISNIQAALGVAQTERLPELVDRKRAIFHTYRELLIGLSAVQLNAEQPYALNSYWMPTLVFGEEHAFNRDELFAHLTAHRIDTRPFFYPLSSLPMFTPTPTNVVSYGLYRQAMHLPSFYDITYSEQAFVVDTLLAFMKQTTMA